MAVKPEFSLPRRIEQEYSTAIRRMLERAFPVKRTEQSWEEWLAGIAAISERRDLANAAGFLARKMVQWVNVVNARSWREAASRSQRSRLLYQLLQREMSGKTGETVRRIVRDNAQFISSVPRKISEELTGEILRAQQRGLRPEAIAKMIRQRFPQVMKSRIQLISRTESSKASTALSRARAEELDLPAYRWQTVQDTRVRASHRNMNGVVVFWNEPPSPERLVNERDYGKYNAGDTFNCRCVPVSVLTVDDLKFPCRVFHGGAIRYMTRTEFMRVSGIRERRAA